LGLELDDQPAVLNRNGGIEELWIFNDGHRSAGHRYGPPYSHGKVPAVPISHGEATPQGGSRQTYTGRAIACDGEKGDVVNGGG